MPQLEFLLTDAFKGKGFQKIGEILEEKDIYPPQKYNKQLLNQLDKVLKKELDKNEFANVSLLLKCIQLYCRSDPQESVDLLLQHGLIPKIRKKQLLETFIPYLGHLATESKVTCALRQEALRTLNTLLDNVAKEERKKFCVSEEMCLLTKELANAILDVGDYDIQIAIMEALFRLMLKKWRDDLVHNWFEDQHIAKRFREIKDRDFETDCRKFLNSLNERLGDKRRVCSIPCKTAYADMNQLNKPADDKLEEFWIDFNFGSESMTFYIDSPEGALWESVRLSSEDVSSYNLQVNGTVEWRKDLAGAESLSDILTSHLSDQSVTPSTAIMAIPTDVAAIRESQQTGREHDSQGQFSREEKEDKKFKRANHRSNSASYKNNLFSESNHEMPSNSASERSWILDSQKKPVTKSADYTRKKMRTRSILKDDLKMADATLPISGISSPDYSDTGVTKVRCVWGWKYKAASSISPLANKVSISKRKLSDLSAGLNRKRSKHAERESSNEQSSSFSFKPRKLFNSTGTEEAIQKDQSVNELENDVFVLRTPEEEFGDSGVIAAFENFTSELKKSFWARCKRMEIYTQNVLKVPEHNISALLTQIHQCRMNELESFHKIVVQELDNLEKRTQFLSSLEKETVFEKTVDHKQEKHKDDVLLID
ncbi:hypothetical protein lerEdw1_007183 [Lerista edwardsae]|nr:hypothetical protein lerEdw1_007183 [Lerista edwardsae]